MVALWDNAYARVKWQFNEKDGDDEVELDMKAAEQQGKYTDSKAGQNPYKGWTTAGLQFYKDCVEMAKNGRKSPNCEAWEAMVLAEVRKVNGITAETPEELTAGKKRRIKDFVPVDPSVLDIYCEDDE